MDSYQEHHILKAVEGLNLQLKAIIKLLRQLRDKPPPPAPPLSIPPVDPGNMTW